MCKNVSIMVLVLACLFWSAGSTSVASGADDWKRRCEFEQVSEALYRGKEPELDDFQHLARAGIRTVVNFRMNRSRVRKERKKAQELGLKLVHIPIGFFIPPKKEVEEFLDLVRTPENQPVYVHCQGGADRVGLMVMAYRIREQGWSYDEAYEEMLAHGFRRWLVTLWKTARDLRCGTAVAQDNGLPRAGKTSEREGDEPLPTRQTGEKAGKAEPAARARGQSGTGNLAARHEAPGDSASSKAPAAAAAERQSK